MLYNFILNEIEMTNVSINYKQNHHFGAETAAPKPPPPRLRACLVTSADS